MSKSYDGNEHIFFSLTDDTTVIKPKDGQTLYINGPVVVAGYTPSGTVGLDTEVIYNDGGTLVGSSNFTYVDPLLSVEQIKSDKVYGEQYTNALGYNELTAQQTIDVNQPAIARSQGQSIAMTDNWLTFGCPRYIPASSTGGQAVYSKNVLDYDYNDLLALIAITFDCETGYYSDISDDEGRIVFCDKGFDVSGNLSIYDRSGSVWSPMVSIYGGVSCKISGDYIITGDYSKKTDIWFYNGTSWAFQQNLVAASTAGVYAAIDIWGDTACEVHGTPAIYVWTRSGTVWSNVQTMITTQTPTALHMTDLILVACSANDMYVYERATISDPYTLTATFTAVGTLLDVTCNGTYIFLLTNSSVKVYHKVSGTWTKSVNDTSVVGVSIAANATNVCIGSPAASPYGLVYNYKITAYTNSLKEITSIELNPVSNVLTLTSTEGPMYCADIDTDTLDSNLITCNDVDAATGAIGAFTSTTAGITTANVTTLNVSGITTVPAGTVSAPSVSISGDANTGLYSSGADTLNIACGGVNVVQFNPANLGLYTGKILALSDASGPAGPEYAFSLDSDTGMYCDSIGTLSFASAGSKKLDLSTVVAPAVQVQSINGSESSPSYSFANATNSGMWYSSDTLQFSIAGSKKLSIWENIDFPSNRATIAINRPDATSNVANNSLLTIGCNAVSCGLELITDSASGTVFIQQFYSGGTTLAGTISVNATANTVAYNTSSDRRLKKDFADFNGALDKINSVKIHEYTVKQSGRRNVGVIADELAEVMPSLVTLARDLRPDIAEDDLTLVDQVDYVSAVPYLIKSIQELSAKVDDLALRLSHAQ